MLFLFQIVDGSLFSRTLKLSVPINHLWLQRLSCPLKYLHIIGSVARFLLEAGAITKPIFPAELCVPGHFIFRVSLLHTS